MIKGVINQYMDQGDQRQVKIVNPITFNNIFLIIPVIASAVLVAAIVFVVGEKYFFDKLIYKKSTMHGYYNLPYVASGEFFKDDNSFFNDSRHKDIASLFIRSQHQILGLASEDDDNYKIAILGDSMSYGQGVRHNQSYPSLLEKYLNDLKIKNVSFTVLNYSMSGDDILDHYVKYLEAKKTGEIDLYILSILSNDFFIAQNDKYPGKNEIFDYLAVKCGGIPEKEPVADDADNHASLYKQAMLSVGRNDINNCFIDFILNKMKEESIVAFSIEEFDPNMSMDLESSIVISACARRLLANEIEIWRFLPFPMMIDFDKMTLSELDYHPSATAHKAYAYYLALNIVNKKLDSVFTSDESRDMLSKKIEKLFFKEASKLK